jgi:UDP-glucose 4-epimerase
MKVLITGARGFIGSSLAENAVRKGYEVLGIGRSAQPPSDWTGSYVWADVALTDLAPIINGFRPDLVVHCAGSASVMSSLTSPLDDLRAAVLTLANTLDGIRRSKVRPLLVFPSSAAVYGNPASLPVSENDPCRPISPYGFHKLAAEMLVREYCTCYSLGAVICRIFSVLGERQRRLLLWDVYQQFVGPAAEVVIQGSGDESRDFIHIDQLADTMLEFRQQAETLPAGECIVNVASGIETRIKTVALLVKEILGSNKPIVFSGKQRAGDPIRWVADRTKLDDLRTEVRVPELVNSIEKVIKSWERASLIQLEESLSLQSV